jgi:hypothetical protein
VSNVAPFLLTALVAEFFVHLCAAELLQNVFCDKGTQKAGAQSAAVCLTIFTALLVAQMQRTLGSFIAIRQALTKRT